MAQSPTAGGGLCQAVNRLLYGLIKEIAANPVARSLAALLLFASSIAGLATVAYADGYVNGGVVWDRAGYPQVSHTDLNPLGVNTFLEKEVHSSNVDRTLQMVRDGGFRWVRQGFAWNDIEIHAKGDYTDRRNPPEEKDAWEKYDYIVDACVRYGVEVIARLDSPPAWARVPGDDLEKYHKGPPLRFEDYGDFVYAVVSRYKGKVRYFQIWNEPNLEGEWGGHPIDPVEYTRLLKEAYTRAKEANPDAVIITAALAPTAENSLRNLNDILFLEGMYRAGAAPYFDILSTMLYGLGQPPEERRTDLKRLNFSRPALLRGVMERYGDWQTPIWISEYSWITLPPDFRGDPKKNIWGESISEETRARWLVEGYERARREWPWMGVISVWYFREPDPDPLEPATYFAIVQPDYTPRPSYFALQEYSKALDPPEAPARPSIEKPLWNGIGFPLLYGLFGLFALASATWGSAGLGRWAQAALNIPRWRYPERVRTLARDSAVVVGMALLAGLYYRAESLPPALAALAGWGLLAFLKPSTGLAMVAFAIPFFWLPKQLGRQSFSMAETLLLVVFGAMLARRAVATLLPGLAARLNVPTELALFWPTAPRRAAPTALGLSGNGRGPGVVPPVKPRLTVPLSTRYDVAEELVPAHWPSRPYPRPLMARFAQLDLRRAQRITRPLSSPDTAPHSIRREGSGDGQTVGPRPQPAAERREGTGSGRALQDAWGRFLAWQREDPFAAPAATLLLAGTLTLFTLADPGFARDSARAYRWVIVEPVLFYFLLTEAITGRRGLWRVADFFVSAAVLVSILGLWQFATHTDTLVVEGVERIKSVYQHPNNLALYLGRVVPFAACLALFLPWSRRKAVYGLLTLPLALALFLTYSRGSWLGVAAAMLVALSVALALKLRSRRRFFTTRLKLVAGGVALALLAFVAVFLVVQPDLPPRLLDFGSGSLRVLHWQSSLRMLSDRPIFGVGLDQFLNQLQAHEVIPDPESCEKLYSSHPRGYIVDPRQCREFYTAHPHNFILDAWLSLGIMGLLALLWLLWRFGREAVALARRASSALGADPIIWALAIGLLASMVDFLVHGLLDNSYFLQDLALTFWLACGLLQIGRRLSAPSHRLSATTDKLAADS